MNNEYLERIANDLQFRCSTVVLNGIQTIPIHSVQRNGSSVVVTTGNIKGIENISSLKLLDETGKKIVEKSVNLNIEKSKSISFKLNFKVKGGE
ncbi:hypothetical protein P4S95_18200 [Aneurinibacillus aneurinilyticus]|uniref:hypothetical protein n=1 Tax=Aneurinibacillus aneurinilyticus TaxID=1391 RepID=UPI002E1DD4D2|nr:hypothetical protein [Aneurinibacillus aneurinilyticus]